MKTAAPGYTRRRPPNGHSRSQKKCSTIQSFVKLSNRIALFRFRQWRIGEFVPIFWSTPLTAARRDYIFAFLHLLFTPPLN